MKTIATFILSLIISSSWAQDIDATKLFTKIVFEENTVRDSDNNRLSDQEIFDLLFRIDTSMNCFNLLELHFNDLTSYSSIVRYLIPRSVSLSESSDEKLIDVVAPIHNRQTGVWLSNQVLFQIDSEMKYSLQTVLPQNNDLNLINSKHEYWGIQRINSVFEKIELDSCLISYKLSFNNEIQFSHSYSNGRKCGLYDESKPSFIHHLGFLEGYWKSSGENLIFTNTTFDEVIIWQYKRIGNKLILKRGEDYIIELVSRSSK